MSSTDPSGRHAWGAVPPTEGERWTRDRLVDLRRGGFGPAAGWQFLAVARRRAGERREARPALTRQARIWVALGAAGWIAPAVAGVEPVRRAIGGGLAWWALVGLMLDWHLGMVETEDGRARMLGAADACTLVRVWLVPLAAHRPSPLICALAVGSDGLDGTLARARAPTRLGRDLDGVADAAFAVAALRGARRRGGLSRLAAIAEGTRLLAGTGYATGSYLLAARAPDPAMMRAARVTSPIRGAGLIAAGLGWRRAADALVSGASLASLTLMARIGCPAGPSGRLRLGQPEGLRYRA